MASNIHRSSDRLAKRFLRPARRVAADSTAFTLPVAARIHPQGIWLNTFTFRLICTSVFDIAHPRFLWTTAV